MVNDPLEITQATIQAEEILLGAILIDSSGDGSTKAIKDVAAILKPEDFRGCIPTDKLEHWVWRARFFYAMTQCELPPHPVNLANKLAEMGLLQKHDISLMSHCVSCVPCSLDYPHYAKAVKDYSIQRQIKYHANLGNIDKLRNLTQTNFTGGVEGL